jgi:hypothetical protein
MKNIPSITKITRVNVVLFVYQLVFLTFLLVLSSCAKLIDVNAPDTSLSDKNVYATDLTAAAVLTGIYADMSADENRNFTSFSAGIPLMSLYPALSADELTLYEGVNNPICLAYYQNALTSLNVGSLDFWGKMYQTVYKINAAIEGLDNSTTLTPAVKHQLLGEAYFMRAFCYFYLANLYGAVPLVINTDYTLSAKQGRSPETEVYQKIKADLIQAQNLLSTDYMDATVLKTTTERVRPNKAAATALLAREYLYTSDWRNAELEATKLIENAGVYNLVDLNEVFLKNSKETIWSLQPIGTGVNANTGTARLFILPGSGPSDVYPVYISPYLRDSFEAGDQRFSKWLGSVNVDGTVFYYAYKYKMGAVNAATPSEYAMVLRLGEQFLIRAEARAQQGKYGLARDDLNAIRRRAGLLPSGVDTKEDLLKSIYQERRVELFTEWGNRWLDLKRTQTINRVMPDVTRQKGGSWDSRWSVYPIPLRELQNNPNLVQNAGY